MPELPEVELYTRYFARHALGQPIARVDVRDPRILDEPRPGTFARKVKGRTFTAVRRHGKHLFADAGGVWLHLHFGMTGDLAYYRDAGDEPRFARVVFDFENGAHLAYEDMRLFGVVELVDSPDAYIASHRLGTDPLDPRCTLADFRARIAARRGAIKAVLMGQEVVAGLGNLYVDETLFATGIHPRRPADGLDADEVRAMFTTMRKMLRDVIARKEGGRDYARGFLIHRREVGEPCPRCGGTIGREVVGGRTTYFCGGHQRDPT